MEQHKHEIEEIKPCPFCGNQPHLWNHYNEWYVDCEENDCINPGTPNGLTKELAIKRWNTRKQPDVQVSEFNVKEAINHATEKCPFEEGTDKHFGYHTALGKMLQSFAMDKFSPPKTARREKLEYYDEKYDDNWPEGSLEEFIWTRCEANNRRVREIMDFISKEFGVGDAKAMLCNHANEVPSICPCDNDCYCKDNTCKVKTSPSEVVEALEECILVMKHNDDLGWSDVAISHAKKALLKARSGGGEGK